MDEKVIPQVSSIWKKIGKRGFKIEGESVSIGLKET